MRKVYIFGLIAVALLVIGIAIADEIKFSTYYPAPAGMYRQFSTTGRTTLATDEYDIETDEFARVGIGTTEPGALLDVGGGTATNIDGTDDLLVKDDLEVDGDAYFEGAVYGTFNNRGDPSTWDFRETNLVLDGNWHDLDLSSIVPSGATAVLIRMQVVHPTTVGQYFEIRKKGNSNVHSSSQVLNQVGNVWSVGDYIIICDSNRIVEYRSTVAFSGVGIVIKGWW